MSSVNALDIFIVIMLAVQAVVWAEDGFARRSLSLVGFWFGLLIGAALSPFALKLVDSPLSGMLVVVLLIILLSVVFSTVGRLAGHKIKTGLMQIKLGKADALLGSVVGVLAGLAAIWMLAAVISGTPFKLPNQLIRDSAVVQNLNRVMPPPPDVFSRIAGLINNSRYPQVFIGPEPQPIAPVNPPSSKELAQALESAGSSVVRLESAGCGGTVFGSGFVAAKNTIVTNAHVVAGIQNPTITDKNGQRNGKVIFFDPDIDMAILRADNLAGKPLNIDKSIFRRGTTAATLGYPRGGPLEVVPAGVLGNLNARGYNIYNSSPVERSIYMLQTTVVPGNSGGPVVTSDGTVIGMIFGRSEADENVGYAITGPEISTRLDRATNKSAQVSTQMCTR